MIILTDEQKMLQEMASSWVMDRVPVSGVRALRSELRDSGFDPALYTEMAQMGWPAILIAEEHGGVGMDLTSLGLIAEELGRNLVASPLISSAGGAVSAIQLGKNGQARSEYLPSIADGSAIWAIAADEGPHHKPESIATQATRTGDGWEITGKKGAVPEAMAADMLVVLAALEDDTPALFAVSAGLPGITRSALQRIDSRGAADVELQSVQVAESALLGSGSEYVASVLDRVRALIAAEMLGGAVQAFETTIDYMKTRIQFDQPIGSFQALQHRVADLLGELVLARSAVYGALKALDEGTADSARLVSLAKASAGATFRRTAREMIQLHGGIGMTDEHDAGLYLKRAHVADHTLGNVAFHRARYAQFIQI